MIDAILCDTLNVAIGGSYLMNLDFLVWYMINYFRIHKFVGIPSQKDSCQTHYSANWTDISKKSRDFFIREL